MAAKVRNRNGKWVIRVDFNGKQKLVTFGPTKADRRRAERAAEEINHRIALGQFRDGPAESKPDPVPFARLAEDWLRREIELPIDRGHRGHLAPGTARRYRSEIAVHLEPYFAEMDVRSIGVRQVQAFHDHCLERGRPRSARSMEMVLTVLQLILSYALRQDIVEINAVDTWKRRRPRRRGSSGQPVRREKVLSAEERERVLRVAASQYPRFYPLLLFLAETGCRLGEAVALRWIDVDLEAGTARICRSFSSGEHLGPTKTRRERTIDLSMRLRSELFDRLPNVYPVPEGALVFPGISGGFLGSRHFREKVFKRIIREALGAGRHHSPHDLRHTWASLHMARGTPLKWIQAQGGWTTAKVLLDTYGHYMPTESHGFADALAVPGGTIRDRAALELEDAEDAMPEAPDQEDESDSPPAGTSPRSPIMHFTEPPPFL